LIGIENLSKALDEQKVEQCLSEVTIGDKSHFYKEASVNNIANRKENISIGEGTHIRGELTVYGYGKGISIGDNCYIGVGSVIRAGEQISIGNNVLIAHYVTIIDTDSHEINYLERAESYRQLVTKGHPLSKGSIQTAPVFIDDFVWISFNVSILKGVRIGKGAIIAAGSVVVNDVEEFTLVAGNPAKPIKKIEENK
jgi:acetyltransferase-like isoleucine patch superfamily enzyme